MNPLFHEVFQKTRLLSKELNLVLKEYDLFASQWTVLILCSSTRGNDINEYMEVFECGSPDGYTDCESIGGIGMADDIRRKGPQGKDSPSFGRSGSQVSYD